MSKTSEFGLIARISESFAAADGVVGIGDDCAVIPRGDGLDTLVTTDLLIEDRHFLLSDITPEQLGWKSAAVNISDIAAMGGSPAASFLSLALPPDTDTLWADRFIAGFKEISDRFGVPLLGGDTSASPERLFINVTILGECPHGSALLRSGARPGDLILVTGTLGDSAAGLREVLRRQDGSAPAAGLEAELEYLVEKHYRPLPRVQEGLMLSRTPGVHSMMDISDGIAGDLRHILDASGVGAQVQIPALPLSPQLRKVCAANGWDSAELAVGGGEDYELLLTAAPDTVFPDLGVPLTVIGRITGEPHLRWEGTGGRDYQGFSHF